MLPLRDRLPRRSPAYVTWTIILVNVLAFIWQSALWEVGYSGVINDYGFVPYRFLSAPVSEAFTLFTSMFMHGGWAHLIGNMWFLWIFGDNVEDAMGSWRFLAFYLLGGIAATFAQLAVDPMSVVPMVGASGAVSAVMGGYLTLYPRAPITVLNPVPPLWFIFGLVLELPAWFIVLEWLVANLLGGFEALAANASGGIAFFAHVGGFFAGLILIRIAMIRRRRVEADVWQGWRPPRHRPPHHRDRYYYRRNDYPHWPGGYP